MKKCTGILLLLAICCGLFFSPPPAQADPAMDYCRNQPQTLSIRQLLFGYLGQALGIPGDTYPEETAALKETDLGRTPCAPLLWNKAADGERYSFRFLSTSGSSPAVEASVIQTAYSSTNGENKGISEFAQAVVELVNEERAKEGLSPLSIDQSLCEAAEIRAAEIQESFSHTRPDGTSCFTALDEVGASYRKAGENLALGQSSPEQAVRDWMNSPGHRKNIMNSAYSRIGVAVQAASRGYAWSQFFAD